MRLYFARHGESEANILKEFSNRPGKHGLTDKGKRQAERLADNLKSVHFTALYYSPILRAVQTADITAKRLNITYETKDALREYDVGILEGKSDEASSKHNILTAVEKQQL
jgi:broad specificity phosphatase PhoE